MELRGRNPVELDSAAAIVAATAALPVNRVIFGNDHEELLGTRAILAECEEARENWADAKLLRSEIQRLAKALFGAADYRVTNAKLALRQLDMLQKFTPKQRRDLKDAEESNARHADGCRGRLCRRHEAGTTGSGDPTSGARERPSPDCKILHDVGEIREAKLGPDHPATATSLNRLAELYRKQGRYAAAQPLYERALKIREIKLGPGNPGTGEILSNLGLL